MARDALDVFVSYSHKDENFLREFEEHLALLQREGSIRLWHDREITASEAWRGQLDDHLKAADLILLLVSASFLASDYCWDVETRQALERHARGEARVVPILVRPCDWKNAPFTEIQGLPSDLKPVTSWGDRDSAWLDVTQGLRKAITVLREQDSARLPRYADEESRESLGKLKELYQLRKQLTILGASTADIDGQILDITRILRKGPQLRPGEFLLDGRYELLELCGQGGFATVWKAWDAKNDYMVALKILHGHYGDDRRRRERFFRGARKMAELTHPHIVRVLERKLAEEGWYFYAMEYLAEGNFEDAVLDNRLTEEERLDVVLQIGDALALAHCRGVVHRDVKPTNILLDREFQAKLSDFDLVQARDTTGLTKAHAMMGTIQFAAPESFESADTAGTAADIYSLGSTAVFAVAGERLPASYYRAPGKAIAGLECSESLKRVLMQATALEAEERPASIEDFCRLFAAAATRGMALYPQRDVEQLVDERRASLETRKLDLEIVETRLATDYSHSSASDSREYLRDLEERIRTSIQFNADRRGKSDILRVRIREFKPTDNNFKFSGKFEAESWFFFNIPLKYSGKFEGITIARNDLRIRDLYFRSIFELRGWIPVKADAIRRANEQRLE